MDATDHDDGIVRPPAARNMEIIAHLKTLVLVRDPRDCLTARYFSSDSEDRMGIDEYALENVNGYRRRMKRLKTHLEDHDDIRMLKYETMIEDPDTMPAS